MSPHSIKRLQLSARAARGHGDLKPSNILVTPDGRPHVVDRKLSTYKGADLVHLRTVQTKYLDMQISVNLRQIVLFYREALEMLKAAGAEHSNALVVNTSSISGKRAEAWLSVYSATKHAVVGWTEAMNKELGAQGIKSLALCPAFVDAVPLLLGAAAPVVLTVAQKGQRLVAEVKARADVRLVPVTEENGDGLPEELERWVRDRLRSR